MCYALYQFCLSTYLPPSPWKIAAEHILLSVSIMFLTLRHGKPTVTLICFRLWLYHGQKKIKILTLFELTKSVDEDHTHTKKMVFLYLLPFLFSSALTLWIPEVQFPTTLDKTRNSERSVTFTEKENRGTSSDWTCETRRAVCKSPVSQSGKRHRYVFFRERHAKRMSAGQVGRFGE